MQNLSNNEIIHVKKNGCDYIQFKRLLEYEDIITHAFTLKGVLDFGVYSNREKYTSIVIENYKKLCNCLGTDYRNVVRPIQTHTTNVKSVTRKEYEDRPDMYLNYLEDVDGMVTEKKDIILSTNSGDCILMLFFDPVKKAIGNVHAGWKGTLNKIVKNMVLKMEEKYNSNPQDLICTICPCIRKCHFEVDEDVKDLFETRYKYTGKLEEIILTKERS